MSLQRAMEFSLQVCPAHGTWLQRASFQALRRKIAESSRRTLSVMTQRARRKGRDEGIAMG